jgi:hypothetical protein
MCVEAFAFDCIEAHAHMDTNECACAKASACLYFVQGKFMCRGLTILSDSSICLHRSGEWCSTNSSPRSLWLFE